MANLSNINNKFLFTDGDFLKIGNGALINQASSIESGLSITNANVASITLTSTGASGKTFLTYANSVGSYTIYDIDAATPRLTINTSGTSNFTGDVYILKTLNTAVTSGVTNLNTGSGSQARFVAVSDGGNIQLKSVSIANTTYGAGDAGVINCDTMSGGFRIAHNDVTKYTLAFNGENTWTGGGTFGGNVSVNGEARVYTGSNLGYWGVDAGNSYVYLGTNSSAYGLSLQTGGIDRVNINDAGNVFISTPITNAFYGLSLTYNNTNTADFTVNQATGQIKIGGVATGYFPTFYAGGSERMRIDSSGQLNLTSGTYHKLAATFPSTYETVLQIGLQATISAEALSDTITFAHSGTEAVSDYVFKVAGNPKLIIKGTGNVGIGTDSPPVKLSINGWSYNPGAAANAGCVGLKQSEASSYGYVVEASANDKWMMMGHNGTNGIIETTYATTGGHSNLEIKTGSSNYLILQSSGGNVGIGNSPASDAKLEVWNGNLRVRGDQNAVIQLTNVAGNTKSQLGNAGNEGDLSLYTSGNIKTVYLSSYYNSYINPAGGNVGIGITSPIPKLHLSYSGGSYGTDATSGFINQATTGRGTQRIRSIQDAAAELFFDVNGGIAWDISARGSSESHVLNFYGRAATPGYNTVSGPYVQFFQNGNVTIAGTLTQNSDITLKENIKPLQSQLEIVSKLNPVSYNKIGQDKNEIGFIAQEVEELLPELVLENEEGLKSLAYGNMNAILVKAIQELKAEIDELKKK